MNQTENAAGSPLPTATPSVQDIAEQILSEVDWTSLTEGYCPCPGQKLHSTRNGRRDCIVYLEPVPTAYCLHAGCAENIAALNTRLRAALLNPTGDHNYQRPRLTAEDKAQLKQRERNLRIRERAAKSLPQLLADHPWPYEQMIKDSPVAITNNEQDHWRLLLEQYEPADVLWIGNTFDSGKPEHARHFRTAEEWLKEEKAPGQYICPAVFKNNVYARTKENVVTSRFLVVESDTLDRNQVGAVYQWLRDVCELELAAIVDTGNKSLHAWFSYEDCEPVMDELKLVLPVLQCDPKLFTPTQPVRLPGVLRGERYQKLVYLNAKVAHV